MRAPAPRSTSAPGAASGARPWGRSTGRTDRRPPLARRRPSRPGPASASRGRPGARLRDRDPVRVGLRSVPWRHGPAPAAAPGGRGREHEPASSCGSAGARGADRRSLNEHDIGRLADLRPHADHPRHRRPLPGRVPGQASAETAADRARSGWRPRLDVLLDRRRHAEPAPRPAAGGARLDRDIARNGTRRSPGISGPSDRAGSAPRKPVPCNAAPPPRGLLDRHPAAILRARDARPGRSALLARHRERPPRGRRRPRAQGPAGREPSPATREAVGDRPAPSPRCRTAAGGEGDPLAESRPHEPSIAWAGGLAPSGHRAGPTRPLARRGGEASVPGPPGPCRAGGSDPPRTQHAKAPAERSHSRYCSRQDKRWRKEGSFPRYGRRLSWALQGRGLRNRIPQAFPGIHRAIRHAPMQARPSPRPPGPRPRALART